MYEVELSSLGLTSGEAKVYEALLLLGPSTVGPIVKDARVAYSNIYEILDRLIEKGLVSFILKEKTKYFQAAQPNRLFEFLDKQEENLTNNRKQASTILPALEKLMKLAPSKEEVELFIGTHGLQTAYEYLLRGSKKGDVIFFFYQHEPEYYPQAEGFFIRQWLWIRKKGITAQGICNLSYKQTVLAKRCPPCITQRYVPFPAPGNIDVFRDSVLITAWREKPIGILIQSKEISENFKKYFQKMWAKART